MMRHRQSLEFVFPCHAREKFVPKLARGHLDRDFLRPRKFSDIGTLDPNRNVQAGSYPTNQLLIRITAPASQSMIEMRNMQLPVERFGKSAQDIEQHHRIDPGRDCDKQSLARLEKLMFFNRVLYSVNKSVLARSALFGRPVHSSKS